MKILNCPAAASKWCNTVRQQGLSLGFVPTMGALHEGHLTLVRRSVVENDRTCISIFVNPLQFNDPDDFSRYPQNRELDHRKLKAETCDMVFGGESGDMFPEASSINEVKLLDPGPFAAGLEGEFRPGHLEGVCTVVDRLFGFVGPCRAYFGEKDYQQLLVIKHLAERLGFPDIVACPTVRDSHGLALSSRNQRLSNNEINTARLLYASLTAAKRLWHEGERNGKILSASMMRVLQSGDIKVEYAKVRDPDNWLKSESIDRLEQATALIAAQVGDVRLIDNLRLDRS